MLKGPMEVETAVYEALENMRSVDRDEIALSLIDPVVLYILASASKRCMTVSEMVPVVNLPAATCYKLVYQLERLGLIACCGTGRPNGGRGKAAVYTSVLRDLCLDMKNSSLSLTITWKNGTTDEFHREMAPQAVIEERVAGRSTSSAPKVRYPTGALSSD
ncbi:MAG: helix-turn-helix domain-containing protein [Methanomassiliicoccales archaeon]|nr:helix-turn-helix domain-containing protein [Methanomassiliicoccales archaeon]